MGLTAAGEVPGDKDLTKARTFERALSCLRHTVYRNLVVYLIFSIDSIKWLTKKKPL